MCLLLGWSDVIQYNFGEIFGALIVCEKLYVTNTQGHCIIRSDLHLHMERDAEDLVLLNLKVHTNCGLIVPFENVTTISIREKQVNINDV